MLFTFCWQQRFFTFMKMLHVFIKGSTHHGEK